MASSSSVHRAVTAGLSGGLGIALPLVAVAATLPFAEAHELVRADALPFAMGALAGVGLFMAADYLLERREERLAAEAEEVASFTSVFSGADVSMPNAPTMAEEAAAHPTHAAHAHPATPKGVPVIARAADALDEAAAWAEIDAMLNDGSPISCDPLRSKDIYEIALEELRRTEYAAAAEVEPAPERVPGYTVVPAAAPSAVGASRYMSPESTDVFLALAANRSDAAQPAVSSASAAVTASIPEVDVDEVEDTSARDAALASLYGSGAGGASAPAVAPAAISSAYANPTVDYVGHESMWAAALAILDEEPASAPVPAFAVTSPSQTSYVAPDRMALVAEGGNATRAHAHVNSLLEEEFDKVPSKSVRRMSHEFLQVIQGGTASMPRLQAQA